MAPLKGKIIENKDGDGHLQCVEGRFWMSLSTRTSKDLLSPPRTCDHAQSTLLDTYCLLVTMN